MRTLGCAAYVLMPSKFRRTLDPRGRKGIVVGYDDNSKAYRIRVYGKIVISRDMVFAEGFMGDDAAAPPDAADYDWSTSIDNANEAVANDLPEALGTPTASSQPDDPPGAGGAATPPEGMAATAVDEVAEPPVAGGNNMVQAIAADRRAAGLAGSQFGADAGARGASADAPHAAADDGAKAAAEPERNERHPGRNRAVPVRLGEGGAQVSCACPPDDSRAQTGASLVARVTYPTMSTKEDAGLKSRNCGTARRSEWRRTAGQVPRWRPARRPPIPTR